MGDLKNTGENLAKIAKNAEKKGYIPPVFPSRSLRENALWAFSSRGSAVVNRHGFEVPDLVGVLGYRPV